MNARVKKILLLLLAAVLLFNSGRFQKSLNRDRAQLGLTISGPLQDAPPMLAFTTVALGGFRGLISNYLWIRANDLQQDDKFFEAAQLADWITDLEPHFAQVWAFQAWNMAWNISVKFKDFSDRWRWVQRGMQLLRDDGLRYNPDTTLLYQQLGWVFQSKMGQNLDDANLYYKEQWAREMTPLFAPNGTNIEALIHPQTAVEKTNAFVLREKYKIDPVFAQKVDEEYGPLDWRLPEAHAIYWYALGLKRATNNRGAVKPDDFDLMQLRRGIYQSMLQAFHHGRYIANPFNGSYELGPDLELIPKLNDAYEEMMKEDEKDRPNIATAHRNFLKDAVYFLYEDNRVADAAKWFRFLCKEYPDKLLIADNPNSMPSKMSLDEYCVAVVQEDIGETSQERVTAAIEGMLARAYEALAIGQDDRYEGFRLLAGKIYQHYQADISRMKSNVKRIGLPPFADLNRDVLNQLLDVQHGLPFAARAVIRTQLGMPAETNAPPAAAISTNAPTTISSTNAPATNSVGK
jgi:hypothetical protein